VGIWHVDLGGTGSYCLADSPAPPEGFHDYAVSHPLVGELRRTGTLSPIQDAGGQGSERQGSERQAAGAATGGGGYCLAIPLHLSDRHIRTVAIFRAEAEYTPREILLAGSLQPILGGIWTLAPRAAKDTTTSA
jgi:hypothetical protein